MCTIAARNGGSEGLSGAEERPWARWFARSGSLRGTPVEAARQTRRLLGEDGREKALLFNERVLDTLISDLTDMVAYVTELDGATSDEVLNTQELLDKAYARVAAVGADPFAAWITELRTLGQPAIAVQALHAYGRITDGDLAALDGALESNADRVILVAAAALHRTPEDAARLAIETESDGPIANAVVHDVLRQRTVPDVARFIRALHTFEAAGLVNETVKQFAANASGRSNLDKALLHVALLASPDLLGVADDLLWRTLGAIADLGRAPGPGQQDDLVAAFALLCPRSRVLETWFKLRLDGGENAEEALEQVALLLRGSRGPGRDELLRALAADATPVKLQVLCESLIDSDHEANAAMLVRALARSEHIERIALFLERWSWVQPSGEMTVRLIRWVLTPNGVDEAPLGAAVVTGITDHLAVGHGRTMGEELLRHAATMVSHRPPAEIVVLLDHVPPRGGRKRRSAVAVDVGRRLAEELLGYPAPTEDAYVAWYAESLAALVEAGFDDAARTSWHHLADEAISRRGAGITIAETAHQVRRLAAAAGAGDRLADGLRSVADRLLIRYLDQAQSITPSDVVWVITGLRQRRYPSVNRAEVLRASVGRWQDRARVSEVIETLVAAGQDEEADWLRSGTS